MLPIPPPNPNDPHQIPNINKPGKLPESHQISFISESSLLFKDPEGFDGESKEAPFFRVWVKEGSRDGKAKLFWQGQILEAETKTVLLTGEQLKLTRSESGPSVEWKILERKLTEAADIENLPSPMQAGLNGALEKILGREEGSVSEEAIFSFLKTYFPFLEWTPNTPVFDWDWEGGRAEGYLDMDQSDKIFVLFLETFEDGPSLYRFQWKKEDASDLILNVVYTSSKMYLHMGQNRKKFKQFLEDLGIRIQDIRIQYKPSLQRREWTA